jgi:hypothetical protein
MYYKRAKKVMSVPAPPRDAGILWIHFRQNSPPVFMGFAAGKAPDLAQGKRAGRAGLPGGYLIKRKGPGGGRGP